MVTHWENQVKDCLKPNEELCSMLDKLRTEQANISIVNDHPSHKGILESNKEGASEISQAYSVEVVSLKGQLAKEQTKAEHCLQKFCSTPLCSNSPFRPIMVLLDWTCLFLLLLQTRVTEY